LKSSYESVHYCSLFYLDTIPLQEYVRMQMAKSKAKRPNGVPPHMTWRPKPDDKELLERLHEKLGINATEILRLGLRRLADQEFTDRSKAAD
jgi:hypothetical protein